MIVILAGALGAVGEVDVIGAGQQRDAVAPLRQFRRVTRGQRRALRSGCRLMGRLSRFCPAVAVAR